MTIQFSIVRSIGLAICLGLVGACGQTLSIKVERICDANVDAYVRTERLGDDEDAPESARAAVAELAAYTRDTAASLNVALGDLFGVDATNKFQTTLDAASENYMRLTDFTTPMIVGDVRNRAVEETKRLEELKTFRDPEAVFTPIFEALNLDEKAVQAKLKELHKQTKTKDFKEAQQKLDAATTRVVIAQDELSKKLMYGGFRSDSIFMINPGSREYEKVVNGQGRQRPKLVFSKVEAIAAGDSILLAVQENPAYFTMRYVSADPTEVVRNMLVATTRILRVATAFLPAVQGVGAALGTMKPPVAGQPAPAGADSLSVDAAESAIAAFNSALKGLDDADLKAILEKVRSNTILTPEETNKLFEEVKALEAVLGVRTPEAPSTP